MANGSSRWRSKPAKSFGNETLSDTSVCGGITIYHHACTPDSTERQWPASRSGDRYARFLSRLRERQDRDRNEEGGALASGAFVGSRTLMSLRRDLVGLSSLAIVLLSGCAGSGTNTGSAS